MAAETDQPASLPSGVSGSAGSAGPGSRLASAPPLRVGQRWLRFDEPVIMGVVNVTPNSFSTGHTTEAAVAVAHGVALWRDGAEILDVGGEATNPRAAPVSAEEEWARIEPVLRGLARAVPAAILSVDTTKAEVAARAVAAGATIVNDVSGGRFDDAMIDTVAELVRSHQVAYVAGHLRGRSIAEVFAAEQGAAPSKAEVVTELAELVASLPDVVRQAAIVDPCLGFGKGAGSLNLELLLAGAELLAATGRPVLMGPSRKRFLRRLLPDLAGREEGEDGGGSEQASSEDGEPHGLEALSREATRGGVNASALPRQRGRESPGPTSREATRGGVNASALPRQRGRESPLSIDSATVGACLAAVREGAQLLRIHAVALLRPALAVYIRR